MTYAISEANRSTVGIDVAGRGLTAELVADLQRACDRAEDAGGETMLVVRLHGGEEPAELRGDIHLLTQWERALRRLERVPAVMVAVVDGSCGWLETAVLLAADRRIAMRGTRLSLADRSGGVPPGMSVYRLASQIGPARSRRLVLFGESMSAEEALALGVVDVVTDDLETALLRFEESVRTLDAADLAVRRQLLLEAQSRSFEDALGTHLAACDRMLRRRRAD